MILEELSLQYELDYALRVAHSNGIHNPFLTMSQYTLDKLGIDNLGLHPITGKTLAITIERFTAPDIIWITRESIPPIVP